MSLLVIGGDVEGVREALSAVPHPAAHNISSKINRILKIYGNRNVRVNIAPDSYSIHFTLYPDDNLIFGCQRTCAPECCGLHVLVLPSDARRMANFLETNNRDVLKKYCALDEEEFAFYLKRGLTKTCVFLRKEGVYTCSIYEARPMACRLFPIQALSPDSIEVRFCEGVGRGKKIKLASLLGKREIRNYWEEMNERKELRDSVPTSLDRRYRVRRMLRDWYEV